MADTQLSDTTTDAPRPVTFLYPPSFICWSEPINRRRIDEILHVSWILCCAFRRWNRAHQSSSHRETSSVVHDSSVSRSLCRFLYLKSNSDLFQSFLLQKCDVRMANTLSRLEMVCMWQKWKYMQVMLCHVITLTW